MNNNNNNDYDNYDYIIKILMIGSTGVGKSSISTRFMESIFNKNTIQTIGVDLQVKTIQYNNKNIKIQLWDTAGHERFKSITSSYYRGGDCVILVFDLTRKESFDDLPFWINEVKTYGAENIVFFLVGNKTDLINNREVEQSDIEDFIIKNKINFYLEVSAKDNININKIFEKLAIDIYSKKIINSDYEDIEKPIKPSSLIIKDDNIHIIKKTKRCCSIL